MKYQLTDKDRELLEKCRRGVRYYDNGDPMRDALDECDMHDAVVLLVKMCGDESR